MPSDTGSKKERQVLNIAVFVSGSGTNLQAMIERSFGCCADGIVRSLKATIRVVISDRPDAYGLERARKHNIPAHIVDYRSYLARHKNKKDAYQAAEEEIISILQSYEIDYVCLAGYMRLFTPYFLHHFQDGQIYRVLNIHPALLPAFPGRHGYEDTFRYGCSWGGITVHFVDEAEDTGPVIAQAVYPIWPNDSLETVRLRGLRLEYELYSQCINWIAENHIAISYRNGRYVVNIIDPNYENFLRLLTKKAFEKHPSTD